MEGVLPKNPFIIEKSIASNGKIEEAFFQRDGALVLKIRNEKQVAVLMKTDKLMDGTKIEIR